MSKLTIKLPPELGNSYAITDSDASAETIGTVTEPTPTVVRWADCWAGRENRIPAESP